MGSKGALCARMFLSAQICPDDHYSTPRFDIATLSAEQLPMPLMTSYCNSKYVPLLHSTNYHHH